MSVAENYTGSDRLIDDDRAAGSTGFFVGLLAASLLFGLPLLISFLFLWRSGELLPPKEIALRLQTATAPPAIYGSAIHSNERAISFELNKIRQPNVLVIGSSRSSQYREQTFQATLGPSAGVSTLTELDEFLSRMEGALSPDLILLHVDYWWFMEDYIHHTNVERVVFGPAPESFPLTSAKLLKPIEWVLTGRISIWEMMGVIWNPQRENGLSGFEAMGVQAVFDSVGIRRDGSFLNGRRVLREGENQEGFKNRISSLVNAEAPWAYGRLSPEAMKGFAASLATIEARGIDIIVIAPPFPQRIVDVMSANSTYDDVQRWRQWIVALPREAGLARTQVYDFHDPASIGGDDCEYLDARHGGDVTFMRILQTILIRDPESPLAGTVNRSVLDAAIVENMGLSVARFLPDLYVLPEPDFVGIGCKKH